MQKRFKTVDLYLKSRWVCHRGSVYVCVWEDIFLRELCLVEKDQV